MSTLALALIAGAAIGMALGALGGGGSVLAVPALIYLMGFSPASATTAALIIVAATSATALYAHARDGNVAWRTGILFALAGIGKRSSPEPPPGVCRPPCSPGPSRCSRLCPPCGCSARRAPSLSRAGETRQGGLARVPDSER